MPVIASTQLDAFATFPQCADNQFLPLGALRDLYRRDMPLKKAMRERERAVRREYMRALVYSPEVVLNRAYAVNEPQIFQDVRKQPADVAELVAKGWLTIQLLDNEQDMSQIIDNATFPRDTNGQKAWRQFLREFGDSQLRYLKLDHSETQAVTNRFPSMVRRLLRVDEMDPEQLTELFKAVAIDGYDAQRLDDFKRFLNEKGEPWVRGKAPTELARNDFYREFVLSRDSPDTSQAGIDSHKEFAYELKLIVDLAYNNNLPATLLRQSFIPMELPSPLCLPSDLFGRGIGQRRVPPDVATGVSDGLLQEEVVYKSQEAFMIPEWADLTVKDVREIRAWPEWREFDKCFRSLVDSTTPDQFFQQTSSLNTALEIFHGRLSREIKSDSSGLRHLRAGSKVFVSVLHPVLIWAGTPVFGPGAAEIVAAAVDGAVEFGIDISIGFLEERHREAHRAEIEGFLYRAAGVRKNICTALETAAQRREVERIAERTAVAPAPVEPPAQVA
jgi:hypothetical protein